MRLITHLVIHCSATSPKATVKAITGYWKRPKSEGGLGWTRTGYHYLIDANGKVHCLQPESLPSWGVKGHNAHSIHIAYIGGIKNGKAYDTRTEAQKEAMLELLITLRTKYPEAEILGHRDFSPDKNKNGKVDKWERIKECPSFDAKLEYSWLG